MSRHICLLAALAVTFLTSATSEPPAAKVGMAAADKLPAGVSKSDWEGVRAAYEAGQHAFTLVDGTWQAHNPGQQWVTKFDGRGFHTTPKSGGWEWGLMLQSYGFGKAQKEVTGIPLVATQGQRLSYQWDATVQEWFVNDLRGLEHGFTVAQRPSQKDRSDWSDRTDRSDLSFTLGTRGNLQPAITADALGVEFRDVSGTTVLNYVGLKVWDADGKVLASRFEPAGTNAVRRLVDESTARYPIASPTADFGDFAMVGSACGTLLSTLKIGALTDTESVTATDATATGDDLTGSDDADGVTLPARVSQGATSSMTVNVTHTTGATAANVDTSVAVPLGAFVGNMAARFRFTSSAATTVSGTAGSGEKEDYLLQICASAPCGKTFVSKN
ncbi:MAG: hypothetical protein ACKVY0_28460 [Prosthecobacter sp.]|uniref:hypothetical protein n=1 Tax=Prosthecobacter sp. TaxID=1965333 RepID=UPI003902735C